MGDWQYAQKRSATRIFFYGQTFIGNRTNREESFDSHPPPQNQHLQKYEVKNYKQYIDVEKEKFVMKMWLKNKEIRTKQHEKSIPYWKWTKKRPLKL